MWQARWMMWTVRTRHVAESFAVHQPSFHSPPLFRSTHHTAPLTYSFRQVARSKLSSFSASSYLVCSKTHVVVAAERVSTRAPTTITLARSRGPICCTSGR